MTTQITYLMKDCEEYKNNLTQKDGNLNSLTAEVKDSKEKIIQLKKGLKKV